MNKLCNQNQYFFSRTIFIIILILMLNLFGGKELRVLAQKPTTLADFGIQLSLPNSNKFKIVIQEKLGPVNVIQIFPDGHKEGNSDKVEISAQKIPQGNLDDILAAEQELFPMQEKNNVITSVVKIDGYETILEQYSIYDKFTVMKASLMVNQTYYIISAQKTIKGEALFLSVINNLKFLTNNNLPPNYHSILSTPEYTPSSINSFPNLKFPYNGTKTINCAYHIDDPVCHPIALFALDFNLSYEPVRAAHSGYATAKYNTEWGTYITITYDGDNNYYTYYGHLNNVLKTGYVTQGDIIAESGMSGATSPHLHFSLNYNGTNIKPEPMCGYTGFLRYQVYEDCWVDDTIPPVSTITLSGTTGENGWYRSNVTATISTSDDETGIASTEYNLDNAGWVQYTGPFLVTGDRVHTLLYRSVDGAGNREADKSVTIPIDATAPVNPTYSYHRYQRSKRCVAKPL